MKPVSIRTIARFWWRLAALARLQNGSQALVPTRSNKACRIAQDEIEAGKIAYVKTEVEVVKPLVEGPAVPILLS